MTPNLLSKSLKELSTLLTKKEVSAVDLATEALDRAEQLNPHINAYTTIARTAALKQAAQADADRAKGKVSPLTGLPFSLKDAYVTKDIETTCASNVLRGYHPPYSATVYQKLRDLGAVAIGKNNQDAWGHGGSSENTDFGSVKNPWDIKRTAGGSSGGSAAALASRSVSFAIGEDTGGSIRNPSSCCNTTGLKVSYGRVSRSGAIAYASSLDTVGPMAKSVEDCALILEHIAGFDPKDASSSREPVPAYTSTLNQPLKGKKIGVVKEYFEKGLDPVVKTILETALKQFAAQGVEIVDVSIPTSTYGVSIYYILALSETSSNLSRYDGVRYGAGRGEFTKETKRRIMLGSYALSSGYYDAYYKNALKARTKLIQEFEAAFKKVDALIAPVLPFPPYEFGKLNLGDDYVVALYLADLYTCATNPAGIPSLALPAGFTKDNLPVGMQLMGPMFSEAALLNIGHQYQQVTDYHQREPQL